MVSGAQLIQKSPAEVIDRLRLILAGANCKVIEQTESKIRFVHGSYLTQSAPLMPKRGSIQIEEQDNATQVRYRVGVSLPLTIWQTILGIAFCWTVFAPILVYRVLVVHPRTFMENAIAGV